MVACTRCCTQQETRYMQLRTKEGYRALHCKTCGRQERTSHNKCECGHVWHQCPVHRVDPPVHASRKGLKRVVAAPKEAKKLSITRRVPIIRRGEQNSQHKKSKRRHSAKRSNVCLIRHTKFVTSNAKPKQEIIERLRQRLEAQRIKASMKGNVEDGSGIKGAQVEGRKRDQQWRQVDLHKCQPEGRGALTRRQLTDALKETASLHSEDSRKRSRPESGPKNTMIPNAECTKRGEMKGSSSSISCKQNSNARTSKESAAIGRLIQGMPRRPPSECW